MVLLTDADIKVLIDERKILNKPKEFNPILVEKLDKWESKKEIERRQQTYISNIYLEEQAQGTNLLGGFICANRRRLGTPEAI